MRSVEGASHLYNSHFETCSFLLPLMGFTILQTSSTMRSSPRNTSGVRRVLIGVVVWAAMMLVI